MLASIVGWLLGTVTGVTVGVVFEHLLKFKPVNFLKQVDYHADEDDSIPMPLTTGKPVDFMKKRLLKDTSPWLVQPDYDRAMFINNILTQLWHYLSPAIHKEALKQAALPLKAVCEQVGVLQEIRIDKLDLGTRPPRVDSFRFIDTPEDELILETPLFWGGDILVRVVAVVKAGPKFIDVPVNVANVQFKALARVTVKPLVERLPCVGGVSISLMETPHVDFDLRVADGPDILAFPFLPLAIKAALHIVAGNMLVYPNEYALPLMPNFGLPPAPQGMLHVKVVEASGLSGTLFNKMTPFVELEVRHGRELCTKTLPHGKSFVWNEDLDMVVDDPRKQPLRVKLFDADLMSPTLVGQALVPLKGAAFMQQHGQSFTVTVDLLKPGKEHRGKKRKHPKHPGTQGAGDSFAPGSEAQDPDFLPAVRPASATPSPRAGPGSPVAAASASSETESGKKKKRSFIGKIKNKMHIGHSSAEETPSPAPTGASPFATAAAAGAAAAGSAPKGKVGAGAAVAPGASPQAGSPEAENMGVECGVKLLLEVTFHPFQSSRPEMIKPPTGQAGETEDSAAAVITSVRRQLLSLKSSSALGRNRRGVLTLTLKKVLHLENDPDSFVVVTLYDPMRRDNPRLEFKTPVVLNENSPRFNFKHDFVNVSNSATLTAVVYDQPGLLASLSSLKIPGLQKSQAKQLGKVRIPVEDVAVEGRIRDVYPLLEAETGEMHLTLEWNPISLKDGDSH